MRKQAVSGAPGDPLHWLEQVAHLVRNARSSSLMLERALQLLGELLGTFSSAVVLPGDASKRPQCYSWGAHQAQIVQVGQELLDGLEAHSTATARSTSLPGLSGAAATGMLLAVPLHGLQQALGVLVVFFQTPMAQDVETVLAFLELTGAYLGLSLQTSALQERLKARPEASDQGSASAAAVHDPHRIIGHSAGIRSIMQEIQQAARSRSTILLRGESGTGKELVARALHRLSERNEQAFVKLNCAALPESLLESELFGHERGAFTGALKTRRGRFEMADKGTLFLDEIGDISLSTQVKLLRVLQERAFERVGGNRSITVDVRIIAATNVDLEEAVRSRHFREDLYYRLHVVPIVLPPLRERKEDIPLLVGHFLQRFNAENHKALKISSAAMDLIVGYDWPGNVRELENCVERMVVMARREIIAPEDVPLPVNRYMPPLQMPALQPLATRLPTPAESTAATLPKAVADIERERLLEALRRSGGVQTRAAAFLGITPRQLGYKLKKYHITPKVVLGQG
ncbi:MAG: sigma-54 interaction domain-containing protein [Candidatus Tectimicrobiota bacterium]